MKSQKPRDPLANPIYLDYDKLHTADVLLICGTGKESKGIAMFSGGDYSHAALFASPSCLFEADDYGVGQTPLTTVIARVGGKVAQWVRFYPCSKAVVLRHPDVASHLPPDDALAAIKFEDLVKRVTSGMCGHPYSYLERLANASSLPESARGVLAWVLKLNDDRAPGSRLQGLFCSEVVALAYQALGLPLFVKERSLETISPNDLARSRLIEQSDVVVPPDLARSAIIEDPLGTIDRRTISREHVLPILVDSKDIADRAEELAELSDKASRGLLTNRFCTVAGQLYCEHDNARSLGDQYREAKAQALLDVMTEFLPNVIMWDSDQSERSANVVGGLAEFHAVTFEVERFTKLPLLRAYRSSLGRRRQFTRWFWWLSRRERARRALLRGLVNLRTIASLHRKNLLELKSCLEHAELARNRAYVDIVLPHSECDDGNRFERLRVREECAVTSKEVLIAATAKAAAAGFNGIPSSGAIDDWWSGHLTVSFPTATDVMRLEVSGALPEEVRVLAEAVADAYLEDVHFRRLRERQERIRAGGMVDAAVKDIISWVKRKTDHGRGTGNEGKPLDPNEVRIKAKEMADGLVRTKEMSSYEPGQTTDFDEVDPHLPAAPIPKRLRSVVVYVAQRD